VCDRLPDEQCIAAAAIGHVIAVQDAAAEQPLGEAWEKGDILD
jgi:hypothetical protein